VTTTYGYSPFGEVQSVTTSLGPSVLYSQGLQYDALGNPRVSEETLSGTSRQESYSYDAVSRLTGVTRNGVSTTFTYGANSTRVRVGSDVASFDAQDRLLAQGSTTYTWDVHGNRASDSTGVTYTHDGLGRLLGWRKGPTSLEYEVDALDRRVLRRRNGVVTARYVYEGQYRIVAELESGSRFLYATHGHSPDAMVRAGVTYVYVKNHLGSVRAVVNAATGQVVQALDYDVWGNVLSDSSPGFQPFAFAGGLYDAESKLTHFGWRDYDASTGTWTSKDPIRQAGGLNVYLYVNANPGRYIDPSGLLAGTWPPPPQAVAAAAVAIALAPLALPFAIGFGAGFAASQMSSPGPLPTAPLPSAGMPLPAPGPGAEPQPGGTCGGGVGGGDPCRPSYDSCVAKAGRPGSDPPSPPYPFGGLGGYGDMCDACYGQCIAEGSWPGGRWTNSGGFAGCHENWWP
jgi:RHS repeat-associated protein